MDRSAAHVDLYQLTSLIPHVRAGHAEDRIVLAFFSRKLPTDPTTGERARDYVLWAGLQRCLDYLQTARFTARDLEILRAHPVLGPALRSTPEAVDRLASWRFAGTVWSPPEGTALRFAPARRPDGTPLAIDGVHPTAGCPYLLVETDLVSAKLIETPLLSTINHMCMVATKASEVVAAARALGPERDVLEFGQRRTNIDAAVDAALAAYIGGCASTSNVAAHVRFGLPVAGTMDHFAVQAWERPDQPRHVSERAYFEAFHALYPERDILLVDTYDTFGAHTGIRAAVAATRGRGPWGIRIDSALTVENLRRARRLLDDLGATRTKIFISGGLDEDRIRDLADAPVDGYGVGERIVTAPDAPVGVGAIGKVSEVRGESTMKLSRGSGKATLPGRLQCWRTAEGDIVGLFDERHAGEPLLRLAWDPRDGRLRAPAWSEVREHARRSIAGLPPLKSEGPDLRVTPRLERLVQTLVRRDLETQNS